MDERMRFIQAHQSGLYSMTELCAATGISRRIGYKWLARYAQEGCLGLEDRSRAPRHRPGRMAASMQELLLQARAAHPSWGPRKILPWLLRRHPELEGTFPSPSTVGDLFRREGLVKTRPRGRRSSATEAAGALHTRAPNEVWCADFKGEFRLGNHQYCYPFTLSDAHTRFLLACQAQSSTSLLGAQAGFLSAFRSYGLPRAIRTDNGTPFVGHGASGLSTLLVWWIKLGILHQRIAKGRPDQNGRHERMHRTLKAEATRPPEQSAERQQVRFDRFRREYNEERPHEALAQQTPASQYESSPRAYPDRLAAPEYPGHYETRKFNHVGGFRFGGQSYFVAQPLAGETLGLVEIETDVWSLRYYDYELGRLSPPRGELILNVLPMSPV